MGQKAGAVWFGRVKGREGGTQGYVKVPQL